MGYAIIKDINSSKGYALNRQIQNLVPVDSNKWVYIPNTNNITFSYVTENVTDGIYRLATLSGMENYTQPYIYELVGSPSNVSIDPISGIITVQEGFTGNSVNVRIKALYNVHSNCYPTKTGFNNAVSNTVTVSVSSPSHAPAQDVYSDFSLNTFSYANSNTITAATLSTGTPTISYTYKLNGENQTSRCTYTFTDEYDGASVNSNGVVTFTSKNTTDSDKQCPVNITLYYPDGTQAGTGRVIVKQSARVLSSITFQSYNNASSISVNSGDSISASAFVIKATYNSGEVTVGPNSTAITISSTSSGTYGSSISNVTADGTVYIKYGGKTTSKAYTVNAVATKAYITGLYTEDPFRGYSHFHESSQTYTYEPKAIDGGLAYPINVVVSNAAEPMTLEEYNTLQTENPSDYEAFSTPVAVYATSRTCSNLAALNTDHITYSTVASKSSSSTQVPLLSTNAANYAFDATYISSLTFTCTSNSEKTFTAQNVSPSKTSEAGEQLFDSMFDWTEITTFDDINGRLASKAYESSTGKVHLSKASGTETVEKYIKKLDNNTEYFIKCATPSDKHLSCFAIINTGTSAINVDAEYTVNGTTTFYRYMESSMNVAYIHYTTDNTNTYLVTRDPTAFVPGSKLYIGTWKRLGALPGQAQVNAFINKDSNDPIAVNVANAVSDSSNTTSGLYIGSPNTTRFHKIVTPSEAGIYFYKVSSTNGNEAAVRAYTTVENLTENAFGNTSANSRVACDGYTYRDASECIIVFNRLSGKGSIIFSDTDGNCNLQYKEVLRQVTQS